MDMKAVEIGKVLKCVEAGWKVEIQPDLGGKRDEPSRSIESITANISTA